MPDIIDQASVQVEFNMDDVHHVSLELLGLLEQEDVEVGLAAVAMALSLGRIMSPKTLEPEDEVRFVQAFTEFVGTYFIEGVAN